MTRPDSFLDGLAAGVVVDRGADLSCGVEWVALLCPPSSGGILESLLEKCRG
jgi:hypothetical protein